MKHPVHAEYTADGEWQSTGLAFTDYGRMQIQVHKLAPGRSLETPSWAVNNSQLRELLVAFMEERAQFRVPGSGTLQERLAAAQKKIVTACTRLIAAMDRLCARYTELKRTVPCTPEIAMRATQLSRQIETLDTRLRFESKDGGLLLICGIIYHYYRLGEDSVGTGKALGIKPPQVRQTLWRLSRVWDKLHHGHRLDDSKTGRHLESLRRHVAIAEKIAAEHDGKLPSSRWLTASGFEATYVCIRNYPKAFAHIKRAFFTPTVRRPSRVRTTSARPYGAASPEQIVTMYQGGASIRQIMKELRCASATACRALGNAGIEARGPGRRRILTPEAEQVLALYNGGLKPARIAESLGLKSMWRMDRIRRLLKAAGVELPPQRKKNPQWDSAKTEEIIALYESGATVTAITARFGCAHRIRALLKSAGIFQRNRDRGRKPVGPKAKSVEPSVAAFRKQVLAYYKTGMAISDVAEHFGYRRGCGCNRVRSILVRAGLYQIKSKKPRQSDAACAEPSAFSSSEPALHPAA